MMQTQTQQQPAQTQTQQASTDFERLLNKPNEAKAIEFAPYGSQDKIKLTVEIVKKFCAVRTKSGQTCSDRDAVRFMMMCHTQRLNPFAGDAYLTGYDGKDGPQFSLITGEAAFNKRAENAKEFDGIEYGIIVSGENGEMEIPGEVIPTGHKLVGGWARVHRKDRQFPMYDRLDVVKYTPKYTNPFWSDNPAHQIAKCARVAVLRRTFPTMLGGLYIQEESNNGGAHVPFEMPSLVEIKGAPHRSDVQQEEAEAEDNVDMTPAKAEQAATRNVAEIITGGKPETEAKTTPQVELMELVNAAGFDFNTFQRWGDQSGSVPDASSMAGFRDVPSKVCESVLRALRGAKSRQIVLQGLETAKGLV